MIVDYTLVSSDSPGSTIAVSMKVNDDCDPISNMLSYATDTVSNLGKGHTTLSLVEGVMKGLAAFRQVTDHFAQVRTSH